MTKNNDELTGAQRKFTELLVQGLTKTDAYRKAFNAKGKSIASINSAASRLARNVKVLAYRASLEAACEGEAVATRKELLLFHTSVIRSKLADMDESSPLCQEVTYTDTSRKLKMVCKQKSAAELAKLIGAYEPEKVEHSVHVDVEQVMNQHLDTLLEEENPSPE